jgi:hypothetical protein
VAHLFFGSHPTLFDPSQLALRLGVLMENPQEMHGFSISDIRGFHSSNMVLIMSVEGKN